MPIPNPSLKTATGVHTTSRTKIAVAVGLCGLALMAAFATGTIQKSNKVQKSKLKPAQASSIAPMGCQFIEAGKSQETVNKAIALGCQSKICTGATKIPGSLWSKKTTKKTDDFNLYCIKLACTDKPAETIQCKVYKK